MYFGGASACAAPRNKYVWTARLLNSLRTIFQGCIQDFCQGGENLVYVKKGGGEAVCSCRAAAGGWVQEGDVPPPAQNFYLSEIYLHEL